MPFSNLKIQIVDGLSFHRVINTRICTKYNDIYLFGELVTYKKDTITDMRTKRGVM